MNLIASFPTKKSAKKSSASELQSSDGSQKAARGIAKKAAVLVAAGMAAVVRPEARRRALLGSLYREFQPVPLPSKKPVVSVRSAYSENRKVV